MSAASRPCRVVLVGMMGSGKSTIGRLLAERTGWPYHDNDELLQREGGLTARELLLAEGEAELRIAESKALKLGLQQSAPCIVGAPAGTILEPASRDDLARHATVVWLRATPETLAERATGAERRPWLEGDAETWMISTLGERGPLYEEVADLAVDTDGVPPEAASHTILAWLAGTDGCGELLRGS